MFNLQYDENVCKACETVDCLMKCQYLDFESVDAAKTEKLKILKGEDSFVLTDCATCYACEEYCPNNNHPFFQIVELQEAKDFYTAPKPIVHQQEKMYSPKGEKDIPYPLKDPAISLCLFPDMVERTTGRLFEGGSGFLGRDFFCNLVYLHFARMSLIKERLPQVIGNIAENLKKNGLTELIAYHDECYSGFTHWADAYDVEVPFTPTHQYDFLYQRLQEMKDSITPLDVKVAYQRPCSNRLIPGTHHFVDDIFELIGANKVKRKYEGENALCCGSVLVMQGRDELAEDLQEKNTSDMLEAGVEYCVFNCPMCYYTLGEIVAKKGIKPVVMSDLCRMAVGEKVL